MDYLKQKTLAKGAIKSLTKGLELAELDIEGELEILGDDWEESVTIRNCTIESFKAIMIQFTKPVIFVNSHFKNCELPFSYFLKGLVIENCTFDTPFDLQSGGHNEQGYPVLINNNTFHEFVDFVDCWYTGEVIITNNTFEKGTNIESREQYLTFDIPPVVLNNIGKTDIEAELGK